MLHVRCSVMPANLQPGASAVWTTLKCAVLLAIGVPAPTSAGQTWGAAPGATLSPFLCKPSCTHASLPFCHNGMCVASCPSGSVPSSSNLITYEGRYRDVNASLDKSMNTFSNLVVTRDGKFLYATTSSFSENGNADFFYE